MVQKTKAPVVLVAQLRDRQKIRVVLQPSLDQRGKRAGVKRVVRGEPRPQPCSYLLDWRTSPGRENRWETGEGRV